MTQANDAPAAPAAMPQQPSEGLLQQVDEALRAADRHIVEHHSMSIMQEQHYECPICKDFKVFNQISAARRAIAGCRAAGAATPPPESLRDDWPAPLDPGAAAYTLTAKEVAAINRAGEMLRGGAGAATPALTAAEAQDLSEAIGFLSEVAYPPHPGLAGGLRRIRDRLTAAAPAPAATPSVAAVECIKCGAAGPLAKVGDDHPGWLCPKCYAAIHRE
jgi:hypothetical protein